MAHLFSRIPRANIQRSSFDRSHTYKTAFDANYLVPFFVDEVLPGDTFNLSPTLFGRLSTPVVPIMDNLYLDTFFFFVPNRLVWNNWQKFNGEQENPGDSTDYLVPTVACDGVSGTIYDYMGVPSLAGNGAAEGATIDIDALPLRSYNLIWNEWFRDENLQDSVDVPKGDGPDDAATYSLLKRGKRHDYFTSALPWPQKGPGVEIPLSQSSIPVNFSYLDSGIVKPFALGSNSSGQAITYNATTGSVTNIGAYYTTSGYPRAEIDLSSAINPTINSLRQAFQLQRLLERDARGGTRYTEILRSHFGVISPDARLQRPEYLGGFSQRVNINPVQQTSATDSTSPQGNLAAFGVIASKQRGFKKSFVEHGYIIGLVNLRADLNYQQGLNRMWSRRTRYDYYWPVLAHLGEQAIYNKEIFATGVAEQDDDVFGYQERYAEYRYKPNMITGKLRSTDPQSLDVWHLAQKFDNLPQLNDEFISENVPLARSLAVQNEPQMILDVYFKLSCVRPMPVYGVPGLVDHF